MPAGKFGEGVVGRSEDGEGAFAFQSVDEARSLQSGDESLERAGGDGGVNDILRTGFGIGKGCGGEGQEQSRFTNEINLFTTIEAAIICISFNCSANRFKPGARLRAER